MAKYCFITFMTFLLSNSTTLFGWTKVTLNIPNKDQNWILNAQIKERWVIVYHMQGISVSNNYGQSFQEAIVDKIQLAQKITHSFIHIDDLNGRIYIGSSRGLYVSHDSGVSFEETSLSKLHFDGVVSMSTSANTLYLAKRFNPGHDTCDTNVLFRSVDQGKNFNKVEIGDNTCARTYRIHQHNDSILVETSDGIYYSQKEGKDFHRIPINSGIWAEIKENQEITRNIFEEELKKLNIPTASFNEKYLRQIQYKNKKLNTYKPQPGFVYTFYKEGKEILIKLDNLPRLGGIDKKRKMIYYSSLKDLWLGTYF